MEGILVGCDRSQEWLLSWWWGHYSKSNDRPVAFADFGMSERALAWCKERGQVIPIPSMPPLKEVSREWREAWEKTAGSGIWPMRSAWFKKPLACMHSPFSSSLWIDLDCEVRGPLDPVFRFLSFGIEIALAPDSKEAVYNSGVIAFRRGAEILSQWASQGNEGFMGDQDALSQAIFLHRPPFIELPLIYNWRKDLGPNPQAVILHYIGSWKLEIVNALHQGALLI